MNFIDIIIISILLIFIIIGICKGFMSSFLSLFKGLVLIFLAILLTSPINMLVNKIGITNSIKSAYSMRMDSMPGFNTNLVNLDAQTLNTHIKTTINESELPNITKTTTNWFLKISPEQIANKENITLNNILSNSYSNFWSTLISFTISFLLILIILLILNKITQKSKQIPVIKATDRVLGAIYGFIHGTIIICVLLAILNLFSPTGLLEPIYSAIYASKIGDWAFSQVHLFIQKYLNFNTLLTIF